jgi:hypothetical protein
MSNFAQMWRPVSFITFKIIISTFIRTSKFRSLSLSQVFTAYHPKAGVARLLDTVIYSKDRQALRSTIVHNSILDQLGN